MPKLFLRLFVIKFVLLSAYLVSSFLEWNKLLGLPLVALINWNPFMTEVWFGGTVSVIIDGHFWIDHWSTVTILAMIVANLTVVWHIDHVKKT
ncbi:hypothetical protein MUP77_15890 [Candidatus Bathyarchaeota archaeon]|nr:hypothetical protein [Candidatus Bathyarchaeota archaeon]